MAFRRSSRRRRRRRAVRRWPFLLGTTLLLVLIALAIALADLPHRYLSERRDATAAARAALWPSDPELEAARPVYPHSIIAGGISSIDELREQIAADPVVAVHYRRFDLSRARLEPLAAPRAGHVSYRLNDRVYWTRKPVLIPAGELVITDGVSVARARCANLVADLPEGVSDDEPDPAVFDTPLPLVPRGPSAAGPVMLDVPIRQTSSLEDADRWNGGTVGSGVFALDRAATDSGGFPPAVSSDARAIAPALPVPVPQIPINAPVGLPQPVPPAPPPGAPPGTPRGHPPGVFPPGWPPGDLPTWPPFIPRPPGPTAPWHPDPHGGDLPDQPWSSPDDPGYPPTQEVPEPGLTILLLGAVAAVLRRRRKRAIERPACN